VAPAHLHTATEAIRTSSCSTLNDSPLLQLHQLLATSRKFYKFGTNQIKSNQSNLLLLWTPLSQTHTCSHETYTHTVNDGKNLVNDDYELRT